MSEIRKNIFLEDGRRAERRITESPMDEGSEIVTETYEEKPLPKYLTTRIIETKKPMVVARETHILGEDGATVVETRKESLEPDYQLHVNSIASTDVVKKAVTEAIQPLQDDVNSLKAKKSIRGESSNRSPQRALGEGHGDPILDPKKLTPWDLAGIMIILAQLGAVIYFVDFF